MTDAKTEKQRSLEIIKIFRNAKIDSDPLELKVDYSSLFFELKTIINATKDACGSNTLFWRILDIDDPEKTFNPFAKLNWNLQRVLYTFNNSGDENIGGYEYNLLSDIEREMKSLGFRHEDFGSSEEIFAKLFCKLNLLTAKRSLDSLRDERSFFVFRCAECLKSFLSENNITYEDIKSSEQEIIDILSAHYRKLISKLLNSIREGADNANFGKNIVELRQLLIDSQMKLTDFGSSKEEIMNICFLGTAIE